MIFATPDFGASGGIACFVMLVWAFVLGFAIVGLASGVRFLKGNSSRDKMYGVFLLVVSGVVPLSCCFGPALSVRLMYGNYPLGRYPNNTITEGMTADEVVATLGTPHERYPQGDAESWYYWIDAFGISWFGVQFAADGRVVGTHGN